MFGRHVRALACSKRNKFSGQARLTSTLGLSGTPESMEKEFIVPTYAKGGVRTKDGLLLTSGQGCILTDAKGDEYLDLGAGIAVTVLGHCDPQVTKVVQEQIGTLHHVSNLYHSAPALRVAEKLVNNSPGMARAFFCNSGTEAVEAAIKFARVYQNGVGQGARDRFVSFKKSFHGRSLGSLSLTYKPAIREPFAPMLIPNVDFCEYNCINQLEKSIGPDVVAVVLEPVQGEGGITPASKAFIRRARELCDEHGALLIFDEVQIGLGRQGNGRLWSYEEHDGIIPDAVTVAKPLANGLPIGAVMLGEAMYNKVPDSVWLGTHGSTYAANPLVTVAADAVLDKLLAPGFLESVKEIGSYFIQRLDEMKARLGDKVVAVRRPLGDAALYAGIQLPGPYVAPVMKHCVDNNVIVLSAGDDGTVIRLCPPLIVSKEQLDHGLAVLEEALSQHVPPAGGAAQAAKVAEPCGCELKLVTCPCKEASVKGAGGAFGLRFDSTSLASGSEAEYENKLAAADHTVLPEGFSVGTAPLEFFPEEIPRTKDSEPAQMTISLIVPDTPTAKYAAMFTQNAFPGAPIKVGRKIVNSGEPIGAIAVNNKISNVHPKGSGVQDALDIAGTVGQALGLPNGVAVLPSSTGVIGWRLPVAEMKEAVVDAAKALSKESVLPAAKGIMTTDTFPKARSCVVTDENGQSLGRVTGIAKGAGMIEPNMATMLVYLMTDIDMDSAGLDRVLRASVNAEGSFNRISVDSDQSTSDTIVLISSGAKGALKEASPSDAERVLSAAVAKVCEELAQDVVRNGEGTSHVIRTTVTGAPSKDIAHGVAKAVVNSPLVKTAIAGNDANVGRIIGAIGSYVGKHSPAYTPIIQTECEILVGDQTVFQAGEFTIDSETEVKLTAYLEQAELPTACPYPAHYKTVDITVHLRGEEDSDMGASSTVFGADLTDTYVAVNAGYRS